MKKSILVIIAIMLLGGCAFKSVRPQDVDAWKGQPIAELEKHPIFITLPVIKTKTSDGTEIWNYVNAISVSGCSGVGHANISGGYITYAQYSEFSRCMSRTAACNNIFYIKNKKVLRYNPIGTGGARCYTMQELQPGFIGTTNIY